MAYKNLELNPTKYSEQHTNKRSQFYKGFSTVNPSNQGSKLYDFDIIKQDILNHFNTRKGQRVMNPTFGTIIWDLIMEPLTPQIRDLLTQDINDIANFDPRVYPTAISINEFEKGYLVELALSMRSTDQSSTLRLIFDQKVGLQIQ
jgi:phage baseplate assembly protein W